MATSISNSHDVTIPQPITTTQTYREHLWLEVVDFLKTYGFDEYIDAFKSEGFDRMAALYDLSMDDLRDMQVKRGHAKILLNQIEQLKSKNALSPSNKKVRFGDGGASTISSLQSDTIQSFVQDNSSQTSQSQGSYPNTMNTNNNYNNYNNNNHNNQYLSNRPNLPIVDETKNHSPKIDLNGNNNYSGSHMIHHLNSYNSNNSGNYSGSQNHLINVNSGSQHSHNNNNNNNNNNNKLYHHSTINPRLQKLQTPPTHQNNSILNNLDNTSGNVLSRSISARSNESDEYSHTNDYPLRFGRIQSQKSYTHSPHHSFSDAGTVVIRNDIRSDSVYTSHTPHITSSTNGIGTSDYPMSPAMPPILVDMHHDIHTLIESLKNASCNNNSNYDEFHEALVNVTSSWDRQRSEKNLKYLNAKDNYKNYVVLDLLGVLNAQIGNVEEAIKYHTQSINVSGNKYIEAMHNYAYLLHRIGNKKNDLLAIKYYKTALTINNEFAHCWLHFGNLLEDDGKLQDAATMYKKAIVIRPTNAAFHLDLANVLDDLNEFEEASEQYLKCIELQPNDPVYHWNYAISLENQCFFYKAEEAYKRAINLDWQCVDAHINYAHMLENQPTPQYRKAMKQYEIILKIPAMISNTEIMLKLAKLYDHFGLNDKTELLYMNILKMDPTMEDCYILFARYLTNQNRIEDANACFQAGIRHVQSQKLQEQYIVFLKEINNIYNNKNNKNKNNKLSNINNDLFKQKLTNINTSTTSTPTPTPFNRQSSYVPPSPFVTSYKQNEEDDDMGFDYYKPATAPITNRNSQKKKNIYAKC